MFIYHIYSEKCTFFLFFSSLCGWFEVFLMLLLVDLVSAECLLGLRLDE